MSITNKITIPEAAQEKKGGIRDIPAVYRRGARMNDKQRRFALTLSVVLILILFAGIILCDSFANSILITNEQSEILRDAIGTKRIFVDKDYNIKFSEDGVVKDAADGKHMLLLEKHGKTYRYYVTVGTDEDKDAYTNAITEERIRKNKNKMAKLSRFIDLSETAGFQSEDGRKLWITLISADEYTKLKAAAPDAQLVSLEQWTEGSAAEDADADARLISTALGGMEFLRFQKTGELDEDTKNPYINFTRGNEGQIQALKAQADTLFTIRFVLIGLLVIVAGVTIYVLKSKKFIARHDPAVQHKLHVILLVLAAVLLVGMIVISIQVTAKNTELSQISEIKFIGAKADPAAESAADETVFRYEDIRADKAVYNLTAPAKASGETLFRILGYICTALLIALAFALLYVFRYERDLGFPIINTIILIILMAITLYPVINTVAYSFNDGTDALKGGISLLPRKFSTESYKIMLDDPDIYQAALISVSKTIITTVLNLFWTGMLAYTLTRREYVLRKFITLAMVLTMYVNAGLIPNYLLIGKTLGMMNTYLVYIIPTMFSCFNMIIIRTYIAALPNELVESARIDGAGEFRIYWQIIFPLCAPVLATVALFVAVGSWNSWFDTMLYNQGEATKLQTLQYYLMGKLANANTSTSGAMQTVDSAVNSKGSEITPITVRCAITVITALPILIVYPFLQRYFVTGMALGSVKG